MDNYNTDRLVSYYLWAGSNTLMWTVGCIAGIMMPPDKVGWLFVPFAIQLAAGPLWALVAKRADEEPVTMSEELQPEQEEEKVLQIGQTIRLDEEHPSGPMLLEDCETLLVGQHGGASRLKIRAVTTRAFVQFGWQHNFSARKMINYVLSDGRKTKITEGLWTQLTDGMDKAKMIRKEPRKAVVSVVSLQDMLGCVVPVPTPLGWKGWP